MIGCAMRTIVLGLVFVMCAQTARAATKTEVMVPMPDGTRLMTDVWRPNPAQFPGPRPVILRRTPYGRGFPFPQSLLVWNLADLNGYIVVSQDVRGRGGSEGTFLPFFTDAVDGPATMRWIEQQDWCDGNIGSFGASAEGIVQLLALPDAPDSLRCAHVQNASDNLYDSLMPGGAWRAELTTSWLNGFPTPTTLAAWRAHEAKSTYWDPVVVDAAERSRIRARVYMTSGFFDIFALQQTAAFSHYVTDSAPGSGHTLVLGPWTHGDAQTPIGELAYANVAAPTDDNLAFFNHCLKGKGTPNWPSLRYFVTQIGDDGAAATGEWRQGTLWPPPESILTPWYLTAAQDVTTLTVDPSNPVPTVGGANLSVADGPRDQSALDARGDVLTITTAPGTSDYELIGNPKARIHAASATTDVDVVVRLTQVAPNGKSLLLTDGVRRGRFVADPSVLTPLTPGAPVPFELDLGPVAVRVKAGHRLRVAISGTNSPHYEVNPNVAEPLSSSPTPVMTTLSIYTDPAHPSTVTLPVASGTPPLPPPPPPPGEGVDAGAPTGYNCGAGPGQAVSMGVAGGVIFALRRRRRHG